MLLLLLLVHACTRAKGVPACPYVLQFPENEPLTPVRQQQLLASHAATERGINAVEDFLKLFAYNTADGQMGPPTHDAALKRVQEWRQRQPLHWLQVRSC
jgi:hypothetical protein